MRTLGEAFRSTFERHEEWPRTALAGLGDQVALNTPVGAIEQGELWLIDDGAGPAHQSLLILTEDRLFVGQTVVGGGGLRWMTLSSVKSVESVDDTTTGERRHVELFLQGGHGVGVRCSDPFVETLVEALRASIETDGPPPTVEPSIPGETPPGQATHLADALGEVDNDPSGLDGLETPGAREGTVPTVSADGDSPGTATPLDDEPVILPTRNRGRAYDVGLEAERNLTAGATMAAQIVSDAPQPMVPQPVQPDAVGPKALARPDTDAIAETEPAPTESLLANAPDSPPSGEPRHQFGGTSFVTAFDVPEAVGIEHGPDLPSATPESADRQEQPAAEVPLVVVAPTTEDVPQVDLAPEPTGLPSEVEQALDESWMSWPTNAPTLATPAGYGAEEYDPAVDDFSDLAAGATSFDGPEEHQPKPQPSMVGVTKANDGWWRTMPIWPDAVRSMTYLGGHPELVKKRKNITMLFSPEGIRAEVSGFGSWKIELPWDQVTGMNVESSDELIYHTNMRIDLSSAALTVQTDAGTLYFECRLRRPASVRSMLAPVLNAMGGTVG